MKKQWMLGLLIVSLAFNLAFLGGFIYRRATFEKRFPPLEERFDKSRREVIHQRLEEFRCRGQEQRINFRNARIEFIESLKADNFDPQMAESRLAAAIEEHMAMERQIGESFIELRQELSPGEAQKFFGEMQKHIPDMGGPNEPHPDHPRRPGSDHPRRPARPGHR